MSAPLYVRACTYGCVCVCVCARTKVRALNTTSSTIGRIAEGEQRQPPIGLKHTLLSIAGDIYRCARVCGCVYTRPYPSCIVALANEKVASFAIPERERHCTVGKYRNPRSDRRSVSGLAARWRFREKIGSRRLSVRRFCGTIRRDVYRECSPRGLSPSSRPCNVPVTCKKTNADDKPIGRFCSLLLLERKSAIFSFANCDRL